MVMGSFSQILPQNSGYIFSYILLKYQVKYFAFILFQTIPTLGNQDVYHGLDTALLSLKISNSGIINTPAPFGFSI